MKKFPPPTWLIVVMVLGMISGSQKAFDLSTKSFKDTQRKAAIYLNEPLMPENSVLKVLSMGQNQALADYLWISTIQYFGTGNPYGKYPALGGMLQKITDLDPKFAYPYQFGLVVLPFMDQTDSAIKLGEKAMIEIPNNGLLTYYLASDYHLNKKDYAKASYYYEKASNLPDAPLAARSLAAVTKSQINSTVDDRLAAAYFWQVVAEKATDVDSKERAINWYNHMLIVYQLEKASEQYKKDLGSYPATLEDLVKAKYVSQIPKSPIQRKLVLNPETGKISFDQLEE